MLHFDETKAGADVTAALALRNQIEQAADAIFSKGFEHLFFLGIGGTYACGLEVECLLKARSTLSVHVENAAEYAAMGNPRLGSRSVVVVPSATGSTPEIIAAVEKALDAGATLIGFVDDGNAPLAAKMAYNMASPNESYLKLLLFSLRLLYRRGEFPAYPVFWSEMEAHLSKGLVEAQKQADSFAQAYAARHSQDALHYYVGAGNLWGAAYSYAMCYLEEMLWMRTKSIHGAEFFHGTLEVIDRDTNVTIFIGEDESRSLGLRVARFAHRVSANVEEIDTLLYPMEGISQEFRGILSPLIIAAVYRRINAYLEKERRHPMEIRRYYRCLDY